jgi:hypothetical protein
MVRVAVVVGVDEAKIQKADGLLMLFKVKVAVARQSQSSRVPLLRSKLC